MPPTYGPMSGFCSLAAAGDTQPANDHSLTPAEYVDAGAPASDRVWTGRDYLTAAKVFGDLAGKDATLLPRYESPFSGSYCARPAGTASSRR